MKGILNFIDLAAQQRPIRDRIEERIKAVLDHGKYIMGPEVGELEHALAEFVGVKHAISCSSGTDALLMGLMAAGIGAGDAVFTTPFTFIATAEVITLLGATPVFVDIDPKTYNIDPGQFENAITAAQKRDSSSYPLPGSLFSQEHKLRGVIAVDLFGLCADYNRINGIAKEFDLLVLEDAAQSFGAEYLGKRAGSLSEIGATSFFPAKPLGCYGDGGAVFTDNDLLFSRIQRRGLSCCRGEG